MKKNKHLEVAEKTSNLSKMADAAYMSGNMSKEEYEEAKAKIKDAQLNNLSAAMATLCKK